MKTRISDERERVVATTVDGLPVGFYAGNFAGYHGLFLKSYGSFIYLNDPTCDWPHVEDLHISTSEHLTRVACHIIIERNV